MIDFKAEAQKIEDQIIGWRRDLHKIPELGLETPKTREYIETQLDEMGIEYESGCAENGVIALIEDDEQEKSKTFAIRADMDGLEGEEKTGLEFASEHKGRMHACGHDSHVAMALGAARIISENRELFPGNIKFLFQPGEEGAGGGERMVEEGALKDPDVDAIIGLHIGGVFEEVQPGQIGIGSGPVMACMDRFKMKVLGKGGHGAMPDTCIDPIAVSASLIESIQTLISREISPVRPGVISVCRINGGSAFNVIPEEVEMEGTARFIHQKEREEISQRMEEMCRKIAESRGAELEFDYEYEHPPLVNPPEFTEFFRDCALDLFSEEDVIELEEPVMGGEDMAYYLQEVPGTFFFLGGQREIEGEFQGHHNPRFDIDESVFWKGTALFVRTAYKWLESNAGSEGRA